MRVRLPRPVRRLRHRRWRAHEAVIAECRDELAVIAERVTAS